jgi:hypothetical protein
MRRLPGTDTRFLDGKYGARILRLSHVDSFSIHDIALVDGKKMREQRSRGYCHG